MPSESLMPMCLNSQIWLPLARRVNDRPIEPAPRPDRAWLLDALLAVADTLGFGDRRNILGRRLDLVTSHAKHLAVIKYWIATKAVRYIVIVVKLADVQSGTAALTLTLAIGAHEGVTSNLLGKLPTHVRRPSMPDIVRRADARSRDVRDFPSD